MLEKTCRKDEPTAAADGHRIACNIGSVQISVVSVDT
jgi:hypothetical protein